MFGNQITAWINGDFATNTLLFEPPNWSETDEFGLYSDGTNVSFYQNGIIKTETKLLINGPLFLNVTFAQTNHGITTDNSNATVQNVRFYSV